MNMRTLLEDQKSFEGKFCSEITKRNLQGIEPEHLRQVLLTIHKITNFNAANTPEEWTPEGSQQPVICIGCMKGGGKGKIRMMNPRFGLCTDAAPEAKDGATGLYLWIDHQAIKTVPEKQPTPILNNIPANWREAGRGRDKKNKFYKLLSPLYKVDQGHAELGELHPSDIKINFVLPDFLEGLGELLKPTKNAINSVAKYAHEHSEGCYTPLAIYKFNTELQKTSP